VTVRAVTFDYWRTLIWERSGDLERVRLEHWQPILADAGHDVTKDRLQKAHAFAFGRASKSWRVNVQYRVEHATDDMLDHLGLDPAADLRHRLVDAFSEAGLRTPLEVAPHVPETLQELRSAGIHLGIVCDVGLTPSPVLRAHLQQRGLLELFDHWSFSDETGDYKPESAPFEHACSGLDVPPEETAHVGDQRRTDVVGALAAGLTAVRYTGIFDDPDETLPSGDVVIERHQDLPRALQVA
jgi:HAD superfamily hydrolase (TIGR01549 family)